MGTASGRTVRYVVNALKTVPHVPLVRNEEKPEVIPQAFLQVFEDLTAYICAHCIPLFVSFCSIPL